MRSRQRLRRKLASLDLPGKRGAHLIRLCDDERGIRVSVVPAAGGEIAGLRVRIGGRWQELLYRALDYESAPPDGWQGRAPLLWPAVGRSFTAEQLAKYKRTGRKPKQCSYLLGKRAYSLPIHGFARDMPWTLESHGADATSAWVTCALADSARTRRQYPFAFQMTVTHRLTKGRVISRYELTAGRNRRAMPFAIGNHISLRLPFTSRGAFATCTVRTPARKRIHLTDLTLLSRRTSSVNYSKPVPVGDGIYGDTFLTGYRRRSAWAELVDPESIRLKISQAERPVHGKCIAKEEDISFVFWGDPHIGYLCPEPWVGRPNALNTGRGLLRLAPAERFIWEMRLAFTPTHHTTRKC